MHATAALCYGFAQAPRVMQFTQPGGATAATRRRRRRPRLPRRGRSGRLPASLTLSCASPALSTRMT